MHGVHFRRTGDVLLIWMDMVENDEVAFQTTCELLRADRSGSNETSPNQGGRLGVTHRFLGLTLVTAIVLAVSTVAVGQDDQTTVAISAGLAS